MSELQKRSCLVEKAAQKPPAPLEGETVPRIIVIVLKFNMQMNLIRSINLIIYLNNHF